MATSSVDRFLTGLPTEAPPSVAADWIAAIARHVADVCNAPVPLAFGHAGSATPAGFRQALDDLEDTDATVDLLGLAWEQLLATRSRRSQGSHFTPRHVADRVVALGLDDLVESGGAPETVWDPSSGGGAFLLAAARGIEARTGRSRGDIVSDMFATDIDPTAVMVCDAALEIWARGAARPTTSVANSLLDLPADWPTNFSLVVGNPPFLGQLHSDTVRDHDQQQRLKMRYGEIANAYVDHSSLFVELARRHLGDCAALALVLPQSFLGARDSAGVRASVHENALLRTLWIDDAKSFSASVEVVAIVVVVAPGAVQQDDVVKTRVVVGMEKGRRYSTPLPDSWAPLLARSQGVPPTAPVASTTELGELAAVTAGFRQHFYGISTAVDEADGSTSPGAQPSANTALLMTSGSIDPLAPSWGSRQVKFAGTRWNKPILHIDRIDDPAVRGWFEDRLVPKILVASQTPVLEVVVDPLGHMVPSVPVVTVEPHDPTLIWHIAAAISAPSTSALMLDAAAGTGLSVKAIRVRASALSAILLPEPSTDWDRGAAAAEAAQTAWIGNDNDAYAKALFDLGESMGVAYGASTELATWWSGRLPTRRRTPRAY